MADDEKILRVLMRFGVDAASLQGPAAAASQLKQKFAETRQELHAMRMEARELNQVGTTLSQIGALLSGPIALSGALYIKNTKEINSVTTAWKATTDSLAASQERIGKIAAEAILPLMQQAADLAKKVADFAEKNPDVVKAVFDIGKVVLTIGILTKLAAEGIRFVADVKLLLLGSQQQAAAALFKSGTSEFMQAVVLQRSGGLEAGINKFGGVGTGQYGPALPPGMTLPTERPGYAYSPETGRYINTATGRFVSASEAMVAGGDTTINSMGGVGNQAYGPALPPGGVAAGTSLAGIAAAVGPMLAVAAAAITVGKAFDMLNTEIIQPEQALHDTMQKHADAVLLESQSYADYQTEVARVNALPMGSLTKYNGIMREQVGVVTAVTQAEYYQTRADQDYAKAATEAAAAVKDLTPDMVLFGQATVNVKDETDKAMGVLTLVNMGKLLGINTAAGDAAAQAAQSTLGKNSQMIKAWDAFQKSLDANDAQRKQQLQAARDQFDQREKTAQATLYETLETLRSNYAKTAIQDEATFQENRTKEIIKFNDETAKLEQQHQIEMQRLGQDHTKNLRKLADNRDALGIEDENDRYQTEVQRKNQDFDNSQAQRAKDFAVTLADQQAQEVKMRADKLAQYNQSVADAQEQYRKEDDAANKEQNTKIADIYQKSRETATALNAGYNDQLHDLGVKFTVPMQAAYDQHYANSLKKAQAYMDSLNGVLFASQIAGTNPTGWQPFIPTHAAGGYAAGGLAQLHANEFVLNADTTRKAERLIGSRLNQQNIIGGAQSITANFQFGSVSDPQMIIAKVKEAMISVARGLQNQGASI